MANQISLPCTRDRGLLTATDAEVFAMAFREDRIVVTANVRDFESWRSAASCTPGWFSWSLRT